MSFDGEERRAAFPPPGVRGITMVARDRDLSGVVFEGVQLPGADFSNSRLDRTNFIGAGLSRALLRSTSLIAAKLREADLRDADLSEADLTGADLTDARLTGVLLSRARWSRETRWPYDVRETIERRWDEVAPGVFRIRGHMTVYTGWP